MPSLGIIPFFNLRILKNPFYDVILVFTSAFMHWSFFFSVPLLNPLFVKNYFYITTYVSACSTSPLYQNSVCVCFRLLAKVVFHFLDLSNTKIVSGVGCTTTVELIKGSGKVQKITISANVALKTKFLQLFSNRMRPSQNKHQ